MKPTQEQVIAWAREAGFADASELELNVEWTCVASEIERFANLVAAAEREACAKACEVFSVDRGMIDDEILKTGVFSGASMCALAIRERGAP